MYISLTDLGVAELENGPFVLTSYQLTDAVNYVPDSAATSLEGNAVWVGQPGPSYPLNANIVRYSILLDRSVGDFEFGTIGLFTSAGLVAVGISSTLIAKTQTQSGVDGNYMRIDAFLSMVGTTYEMWANLGNTDNRFVLATVSDVDRLPPAHMSTTNAYIVGSPVPDQLPFLAYTDYTGIWTFDQYAYSSTVGFRFVIEQATATSVVIQSTVDLADLVPEFFGEKVVQFTTGACYSVCRNVLHVSQDLLNSTYVVSFASPLALVPAVGDEFVVYTKDQSQSGSLNVPIATRGEAGRVRPGLSLSLDSGGLIDVDWTAAQQNAVTTIVGKDPSGNPVNLRGVVQLYARDILGAVRSVNGQTPDANGNVSLTFVYNLPTASPTVKGGIRITGEDGLIMDGAVLKLDTSFEFYTAAQIKALYESNPNTNDFTDAEKALLLTLSTNEAVWDEGEVI